jgi:hypothetical protein
MSWFGMWDGFDDEMQNAPDIFARKPQTNADRIRAMTDEELAEWLESLTTSSGWTFLLFGKSWLDWLKQEATDG